MSVSSSTGSTNTPATSALGVGSGLDLNSIIDGLMKIEAQGQTRIKNRVTSHNSLVNVYQQLNAKFSTLKTASESLSLPSSWQIKAATSSSPNVSASATTAATAGSFSFIVKNLANAETLASTATVASLDDIVSSGNFLTGNGSSLGIATVSGSGLTTGNHTVAVTQASSGAIRNASAGSPLAASTTFASDRTLTVNLSGVAKSYTIPAGTYDRQQLANAITTASNGELKGSVNANNTLRLTTGNEGTAATLQITGGTALTSLGLTAGGTTTGSNGIITVDGVSNTVTDVRIDGSNSVVLNGASGATITASFSGGLRAGSQVFNSIDMGDGKLSTVVSKLNAANMGFSAAAIQIGPDQYKLQLQSNTTGLAGKITADLGSLSALGSFAVVNEAKDAKLQVGTGPGAYEITSSSNTVTALPGVSLTLNKADPDTTVTVGVAGDVESLSNKLTAMVNSVNDAMKFIKENSTYDQKTKASGYLLGNSTARRLQQQVFSAMQAGLGATMTAADLGIKVNSDGTFAFDTAKFKAAYASDPEKVAGMFVEGGTTGVTTDNNPGIAQRIQQLTKRATDSIDGSITTAIKGENTTIADLTKQITNWDLRLEQRRKTMLAQFAAMDTAVAGFKSQGNWLSGQISGLLNGGY